MPTLFAFTLAALLSATVHAYFNGGESIEWVLADSDRAVVGKLVKVARIAGSDKRDYEVAIVAITSAIKGDHEDRVTFVLQRAEDDPDKRLDESFAKQWTRASPCFCFW